MAEYQVLARKYRPKHFGELLGQSHVATALANAIDTGRLHHAYLFTGTRGVGKTTIARILAKCLNCETGITSQPCGVCDTCQAIDAGRFLDLIEIDAASRTKVEDTRDLLENVPYAPVQGRYKVYLIDEVHMLSTHSFNALLKTLEEPPEHVKFIFATTDPQKLPITIISRCLQFVLRPLSQALLVGHLENILKQEHISYAPEGLWQLAQSAKGSVRDCLSLTDQAIAFGGGQIGVQTVREMLGLIDSVDILALLKDIYHNNRQAVAVSIETMRAKMVDAAMVMDGLIDSVHQMAVAQVLADVPLDMSDDKKERLLDLSACVSGDVLQLYYEILLKSRDGIRLASTPMQALEMAILRLLAFRPLADDEWVHLPSSGLNKDEVGEQQTAQVAQALSTSSQTATQEPPNDNTNNAQQTNDTPIADIADGGQNDGLDLASHYANANSQQADIADGGQNGLDNTNVCQHSLSDNFEPNALPPQDLPQALPMESLIDDVPLATGDNAYYADEVPTSPNYTVDVVDVSNNRHQIDDKLPINQIAEFTKPSTASDLPHYPPATDETTPNAESNQYHHPAVHNYCDELYHALLPSVCPLDGEWTIEKWDYWTYHAYANGLLSADEYALVQHSLMVGAVAGECVLQAFDVHYQIQSSFKTFAPKIHATLGSKPSLVKGQINPNDTPHHRHATRKHAILNKAQLRLSKSPVMAMLEQGGFLTADSFAALTQMKFSDKRLA